MQNIIICLGVRSPERGGREGEGEGGGRGRGGKREGESGEEGGKGEEESVCSFAPHVYTAGERKGGAREGEVM